MSFFPRPIPRGTISTGLFDPSAWVVTREEIDLIRPWGGDGDSCSVSRLNVRINAPGVDRRGIGPEVSLKRDFARAMRRVHDGDSRVRLRPRREVEDGSMVEWKDRSMVDRRDGLMVERKDGSMVDRKDGSMVALEVASMDELKNGSKTELKDGLMVALNDASVVLLKEGSAFEMNNGSKVAGESQGESRRELRYGSTVEVILKDISLKDGSSAAIALELGSRMHLKANSNHEPSSKRNTQPLPTTIHHEKSIRDHFETIKSFVIKRVLGPSNRYEDDLCKTQIKALSYKIEGWVLTAKTEKHAKFATALVWEDVDEYKSCLILEDLIQSGFTKHATDLNTKEIFLAVEWCADFHCETKPSCMVWRCGGYWALDKRMEEFTRMKSRFAKARGDHRRPMKRSRRRSKKGKDDYNLERLLRKNAPGDFAAKLELVSDVLQNVLYPNLFIKDYLDERVVHRAYDSDSSCDENDEEQLHARDRLRKNVEKTMLAHTSSVISNMENNKSILCKPCLIHGDFKSENMFFTPDDKKCAVIDFQWTGLGLGVLDLVSLVLTSLDPKLVGTRTLLETNMLDTYLRRIYLRNGLSPDSTHRFSKDVELLKWLFDLALVDYVRYMVGSGSLYQDDIPTLRRADTWLTSMQISINDPIASKAGFVVNLNKVFESLM